MVSEIKALCDANGTSIKALEKELGFGNGTIRRWDDHEPSTKRVDMVAEHFGMTADELKNGIKKAPAGNSDEGKEFEEIFSKLNEKNKSIALAQLKALLDNQ